MKLPSGLIAIIVLVFLTSVLSLTLLLLPSVWFKTLGIVFSIAFLLIGIGLIKLDNFSRMALIIMYIISIIFNIVMIAIEVFEIGFYPVVRSTIALIVIIYLSLPKVKVMFKHNPT